MDKVIIKKSENIDLIENDQEILEQNKKKDGVPYRKDYPYPKDKRRPSHMREKEWEGMEKYRRTYRGPNTDTDYPEGMPYPSVSDEVDVQYNTEQSNITKMVSALKSKLDFIETIKPKNKSLKTKRRLDKVILKQNEDFSESQENLETENIHNDYRTMQVRLS